MQQRYRLRVRDVCRGRRYIHQIRQLRELGGGNIWVKVRSDDATDPSEVVWPDVQAALVTANKQNTVAALRRILLVPEPRLYLHV